MKKLFYILASLTLLCSCSAEKRLAYLLEHHPELHKDTTYVIDTFFVKQADSVTTTFTIQQLQQLLAQDSVALGNDTAPAYANQCPPQKATASIRVENSGSIASITPNADGSFKLSAIQKPDTVFVKEKIPIPVYYTEYKDKIVYKMNQAQTFFFGLGILFLVLLAIVFAVKIAKLFI